MRHFITIILSFILSLSCFAAGEVGRCEIREADGVGTLYIVCLVADKDDDPDVLTKDKCIQLKADLLGALDDAIVSLSDSSLALLDLLQNGSWTQIPTHVQEIRSIIVNALQSNDYVSVELSLRDIESSVSQVGSQVNEARSSVESAKSTVESARSLIEGYSCADKTCSSNGDGTMNCPCQDEFDEVIEAINQSRRVLVNIYTNTVEMSLRQLDIIHSVSNIYDVALNLNERLNAPDDRMWTEVNEIYTNMLNKIELIRRGDYQLSDMLYNVRQLVNNSENGLKLTTEGLITLYNSVLLMGSQAIASRGLDDFGHAVRYFSNTVSFLYNEFNLTPNYVHIPPASKYSFIYSVATNISLDPRVRYNRFISPIGGSVSNWFQRMEYYQQMSLGWFDNYAKSPMEQEQDQLTESSLERQLTLTTNDLGVIVTAAQDATNNLNSVFQPVIGSFQGVELQATLPTLITFLPEIEIGSIGTFGPIQLDTTDIDDYCTLARRVTTLVWRVLIWTLYVAAAFGIGRALFLFGLYAIHFFQNL